MINVIYNYFTPLHNHQRAIEIDFCFKKLLSNPYIDTISCFHECKVNFSSPKLKLHKVNKRITFRELYDVASMKDAVNVIINSDCYLDSETTKLLEKIQEKHFWALSRWNIITLTPFSAVFAGKKNSQDCWATRGQAPSFIELGFCMGYPGCDNRITWEFDFAGYKVSNPSKSIKLYHLHRDTKRRYQGKVAPPYLHVDACNIEDIK